MKQVSKFIILGFGATASLSIVLYGLVWFLSWINTAGYVASTPQRVINKTFQTDNVIHNYEWFHDVVTQQAARVNQIQQFKSFLETEEDKEEKQRLRMEMAAQQMSCRDLVAKYNANSQKTNVGIFRGWSLPENLNPSTCEQENYMKFINDFDKTNRLHLGIAILAILSLVNIVIVLIH